MIKIQTWACQWHRTVIGGVLFVACLWAEVLLFWIQWVIPNGNLGADTAPAGPTFLPPKVAVGVPPAAGSPDPTQGWRSVRGGDWLARAAAPARRLLRVTGHDAPVKGWGWRSLSPHCPCLRPREGAETWAAAPAASHPLCIPPTSSTVEPVVPSGWGQTVLCYKVCLVSFSA